jgi:4-aminobutyrate aminotransferase-like enzyme
MLLPTMTSTKIVTESPGPNARKLIERESKVFRQPGNDRLYTLFSKSVKGAIVEDIDGNRYLDFEAGSGSMGLGGSHPELVKTIKEEISSLGHISYPFLNEVVISLGEKLAEITPGKFKKKVSFECSGGTANDIAFKLCRRYTRRPLFIACLGAHSGFTTAGVALDGHYAAQRKGMQIGGLVPGITHIPYPYCYRCVFGAEYPECGMRCLDYLEKEIMPTIAPAEDIAGILIEPILGPGGIVVPPDEYLPRLKKLCEKFGILFIADEVWTFAKTGKMFASAHWDIEPDMITVAKTLGGGMFPISAIIMREEIVNDLSPGSTSSTYNGYPLGCLTALKTIEIIEKEHLAEKAEKMGKYLVKRAKEIQEKHEMLGDIRGKGLGIGTEWVKDRKTKEPAAEESLKISYRAFQKGLLLEFAGLKANVIKLAPPLIITQEQIDEALDIFEEAIRDVEKGKVSLPSNWPSYYAVASGFT